MGRTVSPSPVPSLRYAQYVVFVLMVVTLLSLLDRFLPSMLVKPIRADLNITDTQISIVQGYSFAIVYCVAGLPIGWVIDRGNRRNLIAVGVLVWSLMTVLSGLAVGFWTLFFARTGVGIGEIVLGPAAASMLVDYFEPRIRGKAIGIYYTSLNIGAGASFILGGAILALISSGFNFGWNAAPWRLAFLIAGVPGIVVAALMLTVREPARQTASIHETPQRSALFGYARKHAKALILMYVSFSLVAVIAFSTMQWAPTLLQRNFNWPMPQTGFLLGMGTAVGGGIGALISGVLSDRWRASKSGGRFRVMLLSFCINIPVVALAPLVNSGYLTVILLGVSVMANNIGLATAGVIIQEVVPVRVRGQALALSGILGVLATATGPLIVALLTDGVFHNDSALRYSVMIVSVLAGVIGLLTTLLGLKPYVEAVSEMERTSAQAPKAEVPLRSVELQVVGSR